MIFRFRSHRHRQHGGIFSNGQIAVYIFFVLFSVWLGFQVWSRYGGGPPPTGLDPMVMAALGVAVAGKSVERGEQDKAVREDVNRLKEVAEEAHPESVTKLERPHTGAAPRKAPRKTAQRKAKDDD